MKNFDKEIKRKLEGTQMPVPEGMWAAIESQIPIKEEKPKYWMLFLLMAFALPLLMYYNSDINSKNMITENSRVTTSEVKSQLLSERNKYNPQSSAADDRSDISAQVAFNDITNNQKQSAHSTIANKQIHTVKNNGNTTKKIANKAYNKTLASAINTNKGSSTLNSPLSRSVRSIPNMREAIALNEAKSSTLSPRPTQPTIEKSGQTKLKFLSNPFKLKNKKRSVDNNENTFQLIEESRIYREIETLLPLSTVKPLGRLSLLDFDTQKRAKAQYARMKEYLSSVAGCPKFEKDNLGIYFYTSVYAGLANKHLEAKTSEGVDLIASRNNSEYTALSNAISIGIGRQWQSGLLFESGINIDEIANRFEYQEQGNIKLTIVIDTIITPTGEVEIRDTTETNDGRLLSSRNQFTQLNIPLLAGYELPISERISIAAKAGILVNLASSNKGQILSADGPMSYTSSRDNLSIYRTNLAVSYIGGVDMVGRITKEISLYGGFSFNYYPSDFSLDTYAIKETYFKYGLNAGIRYHL